MSFKLLQKDDLISDPDCGTDLECGNLTCMSDTHSHYAFIKLASVIYKLLLRDDLRHNSTSDPIVALTLGVGTKILCATYLLSMLYLSAKFH